MVKKFAEVLRGFDDEMDILDKDQWTKGAVKEFSRLQHTLGRSFTCFSLSLISQSGTGAQYTQYVLNFMFSPTILIIDILL